MLVAPVAGAGVGSKPRRGESSGEVVKEAICKSLLPLGNLAAVSKRGHFLRGETRTVGGVCFNWVSCKAGRKNGSSDAPFSLSPSVLFFFHPASLNS